MAYEKRKKAAEEARKQRAQRAGTDDASDNAVLDTLLQKLRNGDSVGRRSRRNRAKTDASVPSTPTFVPSNDAGGEHDSDTPVVATAALDMLARLKSDGFEAFVPSTPIDGLKPPRRRRPRKEPEDSSTLVELAVLEDDTPLPVVSIEGLNEGSVQNGGSEDKLTEHQ